MGQLGIHQDSQSTKNILNCCPEHSEIHLATGYFNMTKDYADTIIHKSKAAYHLLMAHPMVSFLNFVFV